MVVVQGQADLLQVVDALRPPGRLAGGLDGGQQQRDQDRDDRDHHQQLDQREAGPASVHRPADLLPCVDETRQTVPEPSSVTSSDAVLGDGHADRPAPDVAVGGDEADEEVLVLAGRLAVLQRDADHLVAGPPGAVPRAVLGGEDVALVLGGELVAGVEGHVERGRVRLEEHVGDDHLVLQLGVLALVAGVLVRRRCSTRASRRSRPPRRG